LRAFLPLVEAQKIFFDRGTRQSETYPLLFLPVKPSAPVEFGRIMKKL
jgi:hypothetical protein